MPFRFAVRNLAFAFVLLATAFAGGARAAAIFVGDVVLEPDTPGQNVELFITGGEQVLGASLFAGLEDDGSGGGPVITAVDLRTGTIFGPGAAQVDVVTEPRLRFSTVDNIATLDTVEADGLFATFTVDTTGVFGGEFDLNLAGVQGPTGPPQSTTLLSPTGDELPVSVTAGRLIVVVPEPATAATLGAIALAFACRRRR